VRPTSSLWRIADVQSRLATIKGDVRDLDALAPSLALVKPEVCIHLGWYAEPGKYLQSPENVELMAATLRFAERLADTGCARFVGVGTCFEYDTDRGYLDEQTPLGPRFLYSAAKAGTYLALKNYGFATMTVCWARLFYLYGPFEDERRLVSSVIQSLLRGEASECTAGQQVRDFLHVADVASALCAIARSSVTGAINVGSGSPVTVAHVVTTIGQLLGRPELVKLGARPARQGEPPFVCARNQRLIEDTSWQPHFTLSDGLQNTIEWWRACGPEIGP
jgi:nucleoside-diphosphate-sugar epimerase